MSDGARTRDHWNHNPELYQLSYAHHRSSSSTEGLPPLATRRLLTTFNQESTLGRCRLWRVSTIPLRLQPPPDSHGAPGRTRTCDPRLRRPLLYPAELRAPRVQATIWSGQRDSNPRPPAPKAGALPACAMPRRSLSHALDYRIHVNAVQPLSEDAR